MVKGSANSKTEEVDWQSMREALGPTLRMLQLAAEQGLAVPEGIDDMLAFTASFRSGASRTTTG